MRPLAPLYVFHQAMLNPHIHALFHRLRMANTHLDCRGVVRNISSVNVVSKEEYSTLFPLSLVGNERIEVALYAQFSLVRGWQCHY